MSKCLICKISNMAQEVKRHPNWTTIWWLNYFMHRLRKRDQKDISRTCDDHRNPLKLNVSLTDAGKILSKANEDPRLLLLADSGGAS